MNAKTVLSAALLMTVLSIGSVRGQTPPGKYPMDTALPPGSIAPGPIVQPGPMPGPMGHPGPMPGPMGHPGPMPGPNMQLSSWITGDKYDCCGPCCGDGPIQTELFVRTGPSIVAGNGTIADVLQTGLYLGAGGRVLFWDPCKSSAWTVELGLANISNHAHAPENYPGIPLSIFVPTGNQAQPAQRVEFGKDGVPGVTLRALNRTFVDMGGGKEWYLWGSPGCGGPVWRVGCDTGGRWGSASADFNEIRHRTDVIGGAWLSGHADVEIPCSGCCTFQAGCRVEYSYTWSDILQIQNKSDVQDISILFSAGIRY